MPVDNIPDFFDGEKPNAEKFNLLRDAVLQQFNGGIVSTNIEWPMTAYGALDMNNNPILNIGSLNNVLHVNSSKSLTQAIAEANAALGNSVIVVDPAFIATTSATTPIVTADNVTIMGHGPASAISLDATGIGIQATGDGFRIRGLRLTGDTSAVGIQVEGDRYDVRYNFFDDVAIGVQVGSGSNPGTNGGVRYNNFDVADTGIYVANSYGSDLNDNVFNECEDDMIFFDSTNEYLQDLTIRGNVGYATVATATGNGFRGNITAIAAKKNGISFINNKIKCDNITAEAFDIGQMQGIICDANHFLAGGVYFEGKSGNFTDNILEGACLLYYNQDRQNLKISGNQILCSVVTNVTTTDTDNVIQDNYFDLNLSITSGVVLSLFAGNHINGNLAGLLSSTDIDMYYGNNATGTVS